MLPISPGLMITVRLNDGKFIDSREGHPIMAFSDHVLVEFPTILRAAKFIAVCGLTNLHPLKPVMSFTDSVRVCFRIQEFEVAMNRDIGKLAIVTHYEVPDSLGSELCDWTNGQSTTDLLDVTCPRCYDMLHRYVH